jgi:hypothetical protein
MQTVSYRLYPSLLDKFQQYLNYEEEAEEAWNKVNDEYKLTPDEMALSIEAELINSINRCPREASEAADRGTAFNEIVDCLIHHTQCSRDDMTITTGTAANGTAVITASLNGFTFVFERALCQEVADMFPDALSQFLCRSYMNTAYGVVELYGYIDEWMPTRICDIKTTSQYKFGKYGRKWQRHLYPYCVINSGQTDKVDEFEYTVVTLKSPTKAAPYITGTVYREVYTYRHALTVEVLRRHVEAFLSWLNTRRAFITDQRIFGGVNPEGYVGEKIEIKNLQTAKYL